MDDFDKWTEEMDLKALEAQVIQQEEVDVLPRWVVQWQEEWYARYRSLFNDEG